MSFKSGYANFIGKPNAGKSTLVNALMGEKVAIVSPKVQTTRQRILGMLNGDDYQLILSDTPGIIPNPKYKLHEVMMRFVHEAVEDADVIFYMIDVADKHEEVQPMLENILKQGVPVYLVLNKIDLLKQDDVLMMMAKFSKMLPMDNIIPMSALKGFNVEKILQVALDGLPEHPAYFPTDQYTDKTERWLVAELVREKIFNNFRQEIPYSTEVMVMSFIEEDTIIRIAAEIYVERLSQKGILIGKGGESMKKIGTEVRLELEKQYEKKIFLELFVKVKEDWRGSDRMLRQFGFDS